MKRPWIWGKFGSLNDEYLGCPVQALAASLSDTLGIMNRYLASNGVQTNWTRRLRTNKPDQLQANGHCQPSPTP